jgi:predicted DNA binding CopG/RHH family protein
MITRATVADMEKNIQINIRASADLATIVKAVAAIEGVTVSEYTRRALVKAVQGD